MNTLVDRTLVCRDCGKEFSFTAGEQEFFATKGFTNEPKRCAECRSAQKKSKLESREMFDIVCNNCGKDAKVPFRPEEGRVVHCRDCHYELHKK